MSEAARMTPAAAAELPVRGLEHWTSKGEVKLFMWEKVQGDPERAR